MKSTSVQNKTMANLALFTILALFAFAFPHFAHAADLFASGKEMVKDSAGDGSTVNYIVILAAAFAGILVGIIQKNWVLGILTFFGANVFWAVSMGIAGNI
ncbi:type IV conjugative transfer system pilin TraA [Vibrio furnissii]|uniref:type IV conjugative transfer system pilin TraA n=1 Tax=Vibrio furnissii TaxID=29494 RepID=UPI001C9C3C1B|nr:hypothetical protein [Vibrio fluvialis]MCG6230256.1 hypothetical protein [Vibrio furnissii]